jgi:hypothetical protein
MGEKQGGLVLAGLERVVVHNRLRATLGLRWELPRLLRGVVIPRGSRCLEIGTGMGWGTLGLIERSDTAMVIATDYDRTVLPMAICHRLGFHPICQVNIRTRYDGHGCT